MKLYKIPVVWMMTDTLYIEANSLEEAIEISYELPLTDGEYIDSTFEIDYEHSLMQQQREEEK